MRSKGKRGGVERLVVRVESLAFGGEGVGRSEDGRTVFVAGGMPGDLVRAVGCEAHRTWTRAEIEAVIEPSPHRIEPPCPLFGAGCGGCQWAHVAREAQRLAKHEIVLRALRRDLDPDAVRPLAEPSPAWRWRRRAHLHLRPGPRAALGLAERRSHRLVDVPACPQLEEPLDAFLPTVRSAILPDIDVGGDVHLLCNARGDVHLSIDGPSAVRLGPVAARLVASGRLAGARVLKPRSRISLVYGAPALDLCDGDAPFLACADLFLQAGAAGNRALRDLVVAMAGDLRGVAALELHAGSGNFTRDLAARADRVVAVESSPESAALGRANATAAVPEADVEWRAETASSACEALANRGDRFGLVVVDPPRSGLEPADVAGILRLSPARMVYVSCDPQTLARDLGRLARGGLAAVSAVPLDLMPQTFHVEVVTLLVRR